MVFLLAVVPVIFLAGCSQDPGTCPRLERVRPVNPEAYPENDAVPFQYPLDNPASYTQPVMTTFVECGWVSRERRECHAAEDYAGDPGTPVYAFADGEISFSGTMGGYGWLIIVDHPQFNLYSLYGHLSPSRWKAEPGPVVKGELIGYLGDSDENGGTADNPLVPHLHFGIRAGQRNDYPGKGEWRWMAGWITVCPQDAGWLQPSLVIAGQQAPEGGFQMPAGNFFEIWWFPLVFGSIFGFGWVGLLIYTTIKRMPHFLVTFGVIYLAGCWWILERQLYLSMVLAVISTASIAIGTYRLIRNRTAGETAQTDSVPNG